MTLKLGPVSKLHLSMLAPDAHVSRAWKRQFHQKGNDRTRRRDDAAEAELAAAARTDPLAAYDVDVREEGAAIQEYLARLSDRCL